MTKCANKPEHITRGSVFDDLGFSPEEALALNFKAQILTVIYREIDRRKVRQTELVRILDEHQPVVSNLMRGKIGQMSIEKLLKFAERLGLSLEVKRSNKQGRRRRAA